MPLLTPPTWAWAKAAGSNANDYAGLDYGSPTIATDAAGNSYITGTIGGPATFSSTITLTATTYPAVFTAKYDKNGVSLWARQFGGNSTDIYGNKGESIAIDLAGNCYVTGTFHGSSGSIIAIGAGPNKLLTGTGSRQVFVVKYNRNGTILWARQPIGNANANHYARSISADLDGNSYITGYLGSTGVQFGSTAVLSGPGTFVVKYNTTGTAQWATKVGIGYADGWAIVNNPCGDTFITGYLQGTETFSTGSLSAIGNRDVFLAKVNQLGVLTWVKQFGGTNSDVYSHGISLDLNGNIFITGEFSSQLVFGSTTLNMPPISSREMYIAKCDSSGNVIWAKKSSGNSSNVIGNTVKGAPNGDCYLAGTLSGQGSVNICGASVLSNNRRVIFVVKLDTNGDAIWAQQTNPTNTGEGVMGISYDAYYNVYISGYTQGATQFGSITLAPTGGFDILIAKLNKTVCP